MTIHWNRRRRHFIAYARDGYAVWWRRDYFRPVEDPTPWHIFSDRLRGTQVYSNIWVGECGQTFDFDETNLEIIPQLRRTEPSEKNACPECWQIYLTEWPED